MKNLRIFLCYVWFIFIGASLAVSPYATMACGKPDAETAAEALQKTAYGQRLLLCEAQAEGVPLEERCTFYVKCRDRMVEDFGGPGHGLSCGALDAGGDR